MTDKEIKQAFNSIGISDPTAEELLWYTDRMKLDPNQSDWYLSTIKLARHNLTGSKSNTNFQTSLERSKDLNLSKSKNYFHPILGARERWKTSLDNGTNPINGLINVSVPTLLLYGAVTNPVGTLGAIGGSLGLTTLGDVVTDSKSDGKYKSVAGLIQDKTGISRLSAEFANPLTWIGGARGYLLGTNFMNKLASKISTLFPKVSTGLFSSKTKPTTVTSRTSELVALPGRVEVALPEMKVAGSLPESRFTALNTVREIGPSETPIVLLPKTIVPGYLDYWLKSSEQATPVRIAEDIKLGNQPSVRAVGKETSTPAWSRETYPGPMLKSLMEGNPLEKQLSKQGTISLNSLQAYIAKYGNAMEKEVMNAALLLFKGLLKIDYNAFRKAVLDRLVRYERTPDTRYEDYGADRLGRNPRKNVLGAIRLDPEFRRKYDVQHKSYLDNDGELRSDYIITDKETGNLYTFLNDRESVLEFVKVNAPDIYRKHEDPYKDAKFNTYTFSSNKIPNGSSKHYSENTLGHSRTYVLPSEPDVLHVMESLSDWALGQIGRMDIPLDNIHFNPNTGERLTPEELPEFRSIVAQRNYLTDNYLQRQLLENLLYAAENNLKKMRYPTRETAAVIEGYSKSIPIENSELSLLIKERNKLIDELNDKILMSMNENVGDDLTKDDLLDKEIEYTRNLLHEKYDKRINLLLNDPSQFTYRPEYMTILKKYEAFPKMYEKLYGKDKVRIVTDAKGNTWYEVDVPDNFLQREWQYKLGGKLNYLNYIQ